MEPVATSPVVFRKPTPVRDGVFQAGDAAGFIDPFVGDGIAIALRGGALAGAAAVRGDLAGYAASYRAAFLPAFRNARRLRRLMEMPAAVRAPMMGLLRIPGAAEWAIRSTRSV